MLIIFKTDEQLKKMPTEALYKQYKLVRRYHNMLMGCEGPRCCELCREFIGNEEEWEDVLEKTKPYKEYLKRLSNEIRSRPFVDCTKNGIKKRQLEKLADLKGNRRSRNRSHKKA